MAPNICGLFLGCSISSENTAKAELLSAVACITDYAKVVPLVGGICGEQGTKSFQGRRKKGNKGKLLCGNHWVKSEKKLMT